MRVGDVAPLAEDFSLHAVGKRLARQQRIGGLFRLQRGGHRYGVSMLVISTFSLSTTGARIVARKETRRIGG
jgi:hypothetical protein